MIIELKKANVTWWPSADTLRVNYRGPVCGKCVPKGLMVFTGARGCSPNVCVACRDEMHRHRDHPGKWQMGKQRNIHTDTNIMTHLHFWHSVISLLGFSATRQKWIPTLSVGPDCFREILFCLVIAFDFTTLSCQSWKQMLWDLVSLETLRL